LRNFGNCHWLRIIALRTIRQGYYWHTFFSKKTKCGNAALEQTGNQTLFMDAVRDRAL